LLHPPLQHVKLSPSTISSKQIGQTSSSSLLASDEEDTDVDECEPPGEGGGVNRCGDNTRPLMLLDVFFASRELTLA